jgi:hypothetical protein
MKGQAAIFDAITFLLLVVFSVSMMYVFLADYGSSQDRVIRSAHVLNYMQALTKSIFFIDANSVSEVQPYRDLTGADLGPSCASLKEYPASISVADLLKNDVSDSKLDDHVTAPGSSGTGALKPGLTASRCALKELMKPFTTSGFNYFAEVVDPKFYGPPCQASRAVPVTGRPITNYFTTPLCGCDDPQLSSQALLTVAAPFRALSPSTADNYTNTEETFVFRVCIWPQQPRAKLPGLGG